MSRTIKHQVHGTKAKMPKMDKGTKTTMRDKMMRDLDNDVDLDSSRTILRMPKKMGFQTR